MTKTNQESLKELHDVAFRNNQRLAKKWQIMVSLIGHVDQVEFYDIFRILCGDNYGDQK